jgi:uncharacterized lipoprotein YbaY
MIGRTLMVALAAGVLLVGCGEDEEKPVPAPPVSPAPTPTAATATLSANVVMNEAGQKGTVRT